VCLPDDVFVVPEPALELLQSLGVNYQEPGRGDQTVTRYGKSVRLSASGFSPE